jgi:inorganic triphosphatase YgiF
MTVNALYPKERDMTETTPRAALEDLDDMAAALALALAREALRAIEWSNNSAWQADCAGEALEKIAALTAAPVDHAEREVIEAAKAQAAQPKEPDNG